MTFIFWIETGKIKRGIAEKPTFISRFICFMDENRVLAVDLDGCRIGQSK